MLLPICSLICYSQKNVSDAFQVEQLLFEDPENAEYAEIHNNLSEVSLSDYSRAQQRSCIYCTLTFGEIESSTTGSCAGHQSHRGAVARRGRRCWSLQFCSSSTACQTSTKRGTYRGASHSAILRPSCHGVFYTLSLWQFVPPAEGPSFHPTKKYYSGTRRTAPKLS